MRELVEKLEKALTDLRYQQCSTHAERRRARLADAHLLCILENLDRRIARIEEGAGSR